MDNLIPNAENASDTTSFIQKTPITSLMRNKGYKLMRQRHGGTNPAAKIESKVKPGSFQVNGVNRSHDGAIKEDNYSDSALKLSKDGKNQNSINDIALNLVKKSQTDNEGRKNQESEVGYKNGKAFWVKDDEGTSESVLGSKEQTQNETGNDTCTKNQSTKDELLTSIKQEVCEDIEGTSELNENSLGPKEYMMRSVGDAVSCARNQSTKVDILTSIKQEVCEKGHPVNIDVSNELNIKSQTIGNELNTRSQIVSNELYFPCLYCYKSFSRKESLKRHVRIHADTIGYKVVMETVEAVSNNVRESSEVSDETPRLHSQKNNILGPLRLDPGTEMQGDMKKSIFPCTYCGKCFGRKDSRKRHENKLHAVDVQTSETGGSNFFNLFYETPENLDSTIGDSSQSAKGKVDIVPFVKMVNEVQPLKMEQYVEDETCSVEDEKKYTCTYCGKNFSRKDSQKRHENKFHAVDGQAGGSNLVNLSQNLDSSLGESSQSTNRKVDSEFRTVKMELDAEDETCSQDGGKNYPCLFCDKIFSRKDNLKRHENKLHAVNGQAGGSNLSPQAGGSNLSQQAGGSNLSQQVVGSNLSQICEENLDSKVGDSSQSTDGKVNFVPTKMEVDNEFKPVKMEDETCSQDDEKKTYPCVYCDKTFTRSDSRKRHERIHTLEKPHKCTYCDKAFITKSHAKEHECTHTGIRDFVCKFCDKAFATTDRRNRHEKTHIRDAVIRAPWVDNTPVNVDNMPQVSEKTHERDEVIHALPVDNTTVHVDKPQVNEKAHVGDALIPELPVDNIFVHEVPQVCSDIPYLDDREVPNIEKTDQMEQGGFKLFICRFCPKTFPRIDSRKRHERTHTGLKPHICSFCGHSFTTAYHKTLHERIHTKEKPHICLVCNKGFARMDSLRRHEKVHDYIAVETLET